MAGKGGKRPGAGRKAKPKADPSVTKNLAREVLDVLVKPLHVKDCKCYLCVGFYWLYECPDLGIRAKMHCWYHDKAFGKAAQMIIHQGSESGPPVSIKVEFVKSESA